MKTGNEQPNRQLIKELYKQHFDDPLFEYWILEFWDWIDTLTTGRTRNSVPRNPEDLLELRSLNLYYEMKIEYCLEKKERVITDKFIPASIVNLKNLKYLLLENFRKLPEEISQLDSLRDLAVIRCDFQEFPKVLCNLKNIQSINIYGSINKFPEEIGNLTSLRSLKITNTRIESLPESIGNLTNLT